MIAGPLPLLVLDTSVVSIIYNGREKSSFYERQIEGYRPVISFQTLEEMLYGAFKDGWGERQAGDLRDYLVQHEVIWPSQDLVDHSARLRVEREKAGRRLDTADAWIAATALMLECPLASDDRDFFGIPGLTLIQAPSTLLP